jgi:putative protease
MVQIHIYFGVEQLNMRARATINSPWTLPNCPNVYEAKITRELFNLEHHNLRPRFIRHWKHWTKPKANITAVIATDQTVIAMARDIGMEIHVFRLNWDMTNIETMNLQFILRTRWF